MRRTCLGLVPLLLALSTWSAGPAPGAEVPAGGTPPVTPFLEAPAEGDLVAPRPMFLVTNEGQAKVEIYLDGSYLGDAGPTEASSDVLLLVPATPLAGGDHVVHAVGVNPDGDRSSPSATHRFRVDATTPATPTLDDLADGLATNAEALTLAGTTSPDVQVAVTLDTVRAATVRSDARGRFAVGEPLVLREGRHVLSAVATNTVRTASAPLRLQLTVDRTPPPAPVLRSPGPGGPVERWPVLTGTGEPAATVHVRVDGRPAGSTAVGTNGRWTSPLTRPLRPGRHTLEVGQRDAAGNGSPTLLSRVLGPASPGRPGPSPYPVPPPRPRLPG